MLCHRRIAIGFAVAVSCALCCLTQARSADAARLTPFMQRLALVGALAPKATATASTGIDALVNDLSCTGLGDCTGVGDYLNALGDQDGVLFTEAGGAWGTGIQAPLPSNAAADGDVGVDLTSVSCVSPGDCVAVGEYSNTAQSSLGLMLTQQGGRWLAPTEIKLPANAMTNAAATGGAGDNSELTSVACWAAGDCTAVGAYEDNASSIDAMVVTESGGVWGQGIEVGLPTAGASAQVAALDSISCVAGAACSASGSYTDAASEQQGFVVSFSAGVLTASTELTLPAGAAASTDSDGLNTDPEAAGASISCSDAADCLIGGSYSDPGYNTLPLLDQETAGVWATASSPPTILPGTARSTTLGYAEILSDPIYAVACPAVGDCSAVGWFTDNDDDTQGWLLTQQGGAWTPVAAALPANAATGVAVQTAEPGPVSCSSAGNCVASSDYDDNVGNVEPLIFTESGYSWGAGYEPSLPANAGAEQQYGGLGDVSCPSGDDGDCTVVGIYQDKSADVESFALSESGGTWGASTELGLPPVGRAEVKLSLLPELGVTGKHATLKDIAGAHAYTSSFIAVETGALSADWYEKYDGAEQLIAKATRKISSARTYTVKIELTPFGRRRLDAASKVTVTAKASFKLKTGSPVTDTAKFKLS